MELCIGSHVGFNQKEQLLGSIKEALSYGSTTFMFYTGAPQNTMRGKIDIDKVKEAQAQMKQNNIDISKVIVHAPYIINLANNKDLDKYQFSISFLQQEMQRCEELGVFNLVLHPGSHVGLGKEEGIQNIIHALNQVLKNTRVTILLETMAGKGTEIASTFDEIKTIIDGVEDKKHIGICLDTCHLNDAGYDMKNFDQVLEEIDAKIGLSYVKCIHINDSKNVCGSHKDRHENIGFGTIGFSTLLSIIYHKRLEAIPKILETPYVDKIYPPYRYEIEMIREKKFDQDLLEKIRKQV